MTAYGRAADEHVDLILAIVIEGVPVAFVERTIPGTPADLGGREQVACLTSPTEGETRLNYEERREEAASLDVGFLDTDDHRLRALFAAGSRPVAWVQTDFTATDVDLEVNTVAPFAAGDHIYVGAETITIGTVSGTNDLLTCTRGAFSSTARVLNGNTTDGDNVYTVPPYWQGRRAWLYGFAPDAQGLYSSATKLGVYLVDSSPAFDGDETWKLRLAGIAQEYFSRVVGMGLRTVPVVERQATIDTTVSPPTITFNVGVAGATAFRDPNASFPYFALVEGPRGKGIYEVDDVDTLAGTVTVVFDPSFGSFTAIGGLVSDGITLRPIAVVGGDTPLALLFVLLSDEGQNVTTYDRLPGRAAVAVEDYGWRLGAAFTTSEVDTAGFLDVDGVPRMTIVIDGERNLSDLLREWCMLTNTAVVTDADGKLTPVTLSAQRQASSRTIGPDDVIPEGPLAVTHDESSITPILTVRCGYSPITGDFGDTINLVDVDLAKRYQRAPARRTVEFRTIDAFADGLPNPEGDWTHPSRYTPGEIVSLVNSVMRGDGALARRFVKLTLTHDHLDLRIGAVVTLSSSLPDAFTEAPDMRGGTIAGATGRIVARRPRYDDAAVDVTIEILDRLLHVCPAAVITGVTGTTLTLEDGSPEMQTPNPAAQFWAGAGVRIIDRSQGGGAGAPYFAAVDATDNGSEIEVGGVPDAILDGWTIEVGVDVVVLDPETSIDGTSSSGYTLIEAAMLAGDDGVAGTNPDADTNPRWR